MTMDIDVDETIKEIAASKDLVVRLYKMSRDDPNMSRVIRASEGYITGDPHTPPKLRPFQSHNRLSLISMAMC